MSFDWKVFEEYDSFLWYMMDGVFGYVMDEICDVKGYKKMLFLVSLVIGDILCNK